jgi:3-deoxy-D-manno-octulosonic-acid transferase
VFFLYSVLLGVALLAALPYYAFRALAAPEIFEGFGERLGRARARPPQGCIWVVLSSLGEARASEPLLRAMRERWPDLPLYVSAFTASGRSHLRALGLSGVQVFAPPLDFACLVRRVLKKLRPRLLVLVEGEVWPHLVREAHRRGVSVVLASGRLSERAFRRWKLFKRFARCTWDALTEVWAQGEGDAERMRTLGASPERVRVLGNLKFDVEVRPSEEVLRRARSLAGERPVWVAGSVRPGEEPLVLKAFAAVRREFPDGLLFLVPRHPEKSEKALAEAGRGGSVRILRWSELPPSSEGACDVVWVDALGVLASLYACADVVFVGGSLLPYGGHNILEPAYFAKPVLTGPFLKNFSDIAAGFRERGALLEVKDAAALADRVIHLLYDEPVRRVLGERAKSLLDENRGVAARLLREIARCAENFPDA